jgi:hypothetical protein
VFRVLEIYNFGLGFQEKGTGGSSSTERKEKMKKSLFNGGRKVKY